MNLMMNPTLPPAVSANVPVEKAGGISKPETSFAAYFERRMNGDSRKNLLGTCEVKRVANPDPVALEDNTLISAGIMAKPDSVVPLGDGDLAERQALADLLGQLMVELKALSKEDQIAPGEWTIQGIDGAIFDKIAAAAGLDEMAVQKLQAGFRDGENVELAVLLDVLAGHFMEMADGVTIKVPDTELPFLESLLTRMGFAPEELAVAADMAGSGDDLVDLAVYLEKLQKIAVEMGDGARSPVSLSVWEREQLVGLLEKSGVGKELIDRILPEAKGQEATLSFERLGEILARSVAAVKDGGARIELPVFLTELNDLLKMSGYVGKDGGWTPVVQETMENIYRNLLDGVDLENVKIEWREKPLLATDETMADNGVPGKFAEGEECLPPGASAIAKDLLEVEKNGKGKIVAASNGKPSTVMVRAAENTALSPVAGGENHNGVGQVSEIDRTAPLPRTLSELQQQAFEQISRGVLTGLRQNDHHLILKLYPPELGEVKVEMLVRNDQVAVSFSMENSRVKEALEAGMDQFRQNLEQQGFNVGECMVSVGGGNESEDAWQRFADEWRHRMPVPGEVVGNLPDLPDSAFYRRETYLSDHEGAFSVLV